MPMWHVGLSPLLPIVPHPIVPQRRARPSKGCGRAGLVGVLAMVRGRGGSCVHDPHSSFSFRLSSGKQPTPPSIVADRSLCQPVMATNGVHALFPLLPGAIFQLVLFCYCLRLPAVRSAANGVSDPSVMQCG